MTLKIKHDADDFRFFAPLGEEEAELTYSYLDDTVIDFEHTFVPVDYRNNGVADELVKAGLEFVQANNLRFVPSCAAVEIYLKRHPEYNHLVEEDR